MSFQLPSLPYPLNSLEPHLSARTVEIHHGRHHRNYVDRASELAEQAGLTNMTLEELIRTQAGPLFENAAQAWNHALYWNSMTPSGDGLQHGRLRAAIMRDFGGPSALERRFKRAALSVFGSGWTWLVEEASGRLRIVTTKDADCPVRVGLTPLLVCDVWEHAYYLDYENNRRRYLDGWWKLVNWIFAEENLRSEAIAPG
jgi:Fe-Mn family superoxide dismutase